MKENEEDENDESFQNQQEETEPIPSLNIIEPGAGIIFLLLLLLFISLFLDWSEMIVLQRKTVMTSLWSNNFFFMFF